MITEEKLSSETNFDTNEVSKMKIINHADDPINYGELSRMLRQAKEEYKNTMFNDNTTIFNKVLFYGKQFGTKAYQGENKKILQSFHSRISQSDSRVGETLRSLYDAIDTDYIPQVTNIFSEYSVRSYGDAGYARDRINTIEDCINIVSKPQYGFHNGVQKSYEKNLSNIGADSGTFNPQNPVSNYIQNSPELYNFPVEFTYLLQRTSLNSIYATRQNEAIGVSFNELEAKRQGAMRDARLKFTINTLVKGTTSLKNPTNRTKSLLTLDQTELGSWMALSTNKQIRNFTTSADVFLLEKFLRDNRRINKLRLKDTLIIGSEAANTLTSIMVQNIQLGTGTSYPVDGIGYLENALGIKIVVCGLLDYDNIYNTKADGGYINSNDRMIFTKKTPIGNHNPVEVYEILPLDTTILYTSAVTDQLESNISLHLSQWSEAVQNYDGCTKTFIC